MGEISYKGPLT